MASQSSHFNMTKPATNEQYDVTIVNANTDIIDTQMYNNQQSAAKVMVGATANADGESGRVPAPTSADKDKYLKGDGTWDTPSGGGGGSSTLAGLTDVSISSPTDGQALVYDATNQVWINGNVSCGGGSFTETPLFTGGTSGTRTFTLSSAFTNYDYIAIYYSHNDGQTTYQDVRLYPSSLLYSLIGTSVNILGITNDAWYYYFTVTSTTQLDYAKSNAGWITDVIGIKFGGGSGDITDLDFSDMTGSQTMDVMNKLNSGVADSTSGTFTTGGTQYEKVEVNCGFRPTYIQVILPFSNGDTYATYDADISTTQSSWYIPMESRTYTIDLGSETGETGITDITDTGFKFRCNAPNTRNVQCTYSANVSGQTYIQTVDFSDLTSNQIATLKTMLGIS